MTISNQRLAKTVQRVNYNRHILKPRIVHIGFGAFARAHQAFVLDALHRQQHGSDWGYWAVYLNSDYRPAIDQWAQQDFLYSVMEKNHLQQTLTLCGTLLGASDRHDGIAPIIKRLASPETEIISLTITEKGYCLDANGRLDQQLAVIQTDLQQPKTPVSAIGVIVAGLLKRQQQHMPGLTILSCDNIAANGHQCRQAIMDYAALVDNRLPKWIANHVSFPNTMVDRIVPAMSDDALATLKHDLGGVCDSQGIICEPFLQWVIEDDFVGQRPAWEHFPNVVLVDDVTPYETLKLRLLNGAHSFLAYLGYLGGYDTIAETMQNPDYRRAVKHLMADEQATTLTPVANVVIDDYIEALLTRFENPALQHRTAQIATDGSQKLPQRLLDSAAIRIRQQEAITYIALGIAAWMIYVSGCDERGLPIAVADPLAGQFKQLADNAASDSDYIDAMLAVDSVFPATLAQHRDFRQAIRHAFFTLKSHGAKQTLAQLGGHHDLSQ